MIRSGEDVEQEVKNGWGGEKIGKQYELGLNLESLSLNSLIRVIASL